ncbi:MAG: acireductone synthase [Acidobacteria bacterium]|nr:acireductone synthase [Acidobacteriota bacterium]
MTNRPSPSNIRGVLLDIEGTTTPIDFVYSVLFPYARQQLRSCLDALTARSEGAEALDELRRERARETRADAPRAIEDYALWLMDEDRKSTGLKTLQGLIWRKGYELGELRGVVFADVAPALERWHGQERDVRIFSSGSVLAQRLLFSTCPEGDLTRFIRGYFDTTTGSKKDAASYRVIAQAFELPPDRIVFVSDLVDELDAARAAGLATRLALRPGNLKVNDANGHPSIRSFDEISQR